MGKLSNMLYMIDLLNTGNIYTLKELSEEIGVTERMIRYYKNEICIYLNFRGMLGLLRKEGCKKWKMHLRHC